MISNIKKYAKEYYVYLFFILILFLIHLQIKIIPGDDEWFFNAVNNLGDGSLLKYLTVRYNEWTGRIVIEAIMVTLITKQLWIWKILNIFMMVLLSIGIYELIPKKYTNNMQTKSSISIRLLICLLLLAMEVSAFNASIRWITGSFNYLWPMTLGLLAILPFKYTLFNEEYNKKYYFIYFIITILASNAEQVSLVILCFAMLTNIFIYIKERKVHIILVLHNIFMAINTAILFGAPGNYVRSQKETVNWFGNWDMIPLGEKVLMGTNLLLDYLFNQNPIILIIMFSLIFIVVSYKYKDYIISSLVLLPLLFIIIRLIPINTFFDPLIDVNSIVKPIFFDIKNLSLLTYDSFINYMPTFILMTILLLIPALLFISFDSIKTKFFVVVIYVASMCSALSISISPTIYASGTRVFFVTNILIIIILSIFVGKIYKEKLQGKNLYKVCFGIIFIIGLLKSIYWFIPR